MFISDEVFSRFIKPLVFCASLLPVLLLSIGLIQDNLGANPVETLIRNTGDWALRFLLITLAISPLRRRIGWVQGLKLRRMLGLFAFFYAVVHFLLYAVLDQSLDLTDITEDILKRPFILVGFLTLLLLTPLAVTSTRNMMRRLGGKWKKLHQLIYPAALLAILHFWWMKDAKADISEPLLYAVLLAMLLGERLWDYRQTRA